MNALSHIFQPSRSPAPVTPPAGEYQSRTRFNQPLKKTRRNFIPAQSWLAYNWIDKDPELEFVCQCIEESGWTLEQIEAETEKHGHKVSRFCMYGWLYGGTKRPYNVTMATVMAVLGWDRSWRQRGG